ncbi:MAG TPA: hypothetical protein VFZ51_05205 [Woeseiaceae bacterium]
MPTITAQEIAIDALFAADGGQILCTGEWDRTTQWADPGDGMWATTSSGITYYDADFDGHWDAAAKPGGDYGYYYDTETSQWVSNDPDGILLSYYSCFPSGGLW